MPSHAAGGLNLLEPLRKFEKGGDWKESYKKKLLDDIKTTGTDRKINILLLGQVSSGKSSFMNSVAAITKGRISEVTQQAGKSDESVTRKLMPFSHDKLGNIRLFDSMGLEEGGSDIRSINTKDVISVVKGNVTEHYKFDPEKPINKEHKKFMKEPSKDNKMHCLVFVMDANVVGRDNISKVIPRIILLTKIDVLCEEVEKDVSKTYESLKVKNAVELAKTLFDIPDRNIFPVQNYTKEMELDYRKDILTLLALRQMAYFANDYMQQGHFDSGDDGTEASDEN